MEKKDLDLIQETTAEISAELKKLALDIHNDPETGNQEYRACARQKELLGKYGFEITDAFCGIETAYKAVYRGAEDGPKIAMLAEYDALPEPVSYTHLDVYKRQVPASLQDQEERR